MSGVRSRRGRIWQGAAAALAAALTVALTQNTTTAAFTAQTGDAGNQVSSASTFCTAPGGASLSPTADTAAYQAQPATKYGTANPIGVAVGTTTTMNGYTFVRFSVATQAPLPSRCRVTSATLSFFASQPMTGATLYAYRADAAWDPAILNWSTGRPGFTGTPAVSASLPTGTTGRQQWDVTQLTQELYAGPDHGFALRDSADIAGSTRYQYWDSMEAADPLRRPRLDITWG
jgi:hypothetical protein